MTRITRTIAMTGVLLGCDALDPKICTEIGCSSGLTVQLASTPVGAYSVEIVTSPVAGGATYKFSCPGTSTCGPAFFESYLGTSPLIRVTSSAGTKDTQLSDVAYTTGQPNGKGCPPVCTSATVTVPIP